MRIQRPRRSVEGAEVNSRCVWSCCCAGTIAGTYTGTCTQEAYVNPVYQPNAMQCSLASSLNEYHTYPFRLGWKSLIHSDRGPLLSLTWQTGMGYWDPQSPCNWKHEHSEMVL